MMTVLITFPCLHSKKGTNLENGMFWNKATEGTTTPQSRERNKESNGAGLLNTSLIPLDHFYVNKLNFPFLK